MTLSISKDSESQWMPCYPIRDLVLNGLVLRLKTSSRKAYEMSDIKNPREEIDVAEVHDCFSITELAIYEDFGFSPRGKAKEDIDSGFFELEGGLPVNPDGGLKCFGHPVGASGLRMTYEIYKQLQGKADLPERQIKDPKLGLSHTFGGPPQLSAVAVFGNEKDKKYVK